MADADIPQLLLTAGVLVTDFSSVSMDFVYMEKPILYFQFDRDDFRKGHQSVGYFDYDRDGFGPVARRYPASLQHLKRYFQMVARWQTHINRGLTAFTPERYKTVKGPTKL